MSTLSERRHQKPCNQSTCEHGRVPTHAQRTTRLKPRGAHRNRTGVNGFAGAFADAAFRLFKRNCQAVPPSVPPSPPRRQVLNAYFLSDAGGFGESGTRFDGAGGFLGVFCGVRAPSLIGPGPRRGGGEPSLRGGGFTSRSPSCPWAAREEPASWAPEDLSASSARSAHPPEDACCQTCS